MGISDVMNTGDVWRAIEDLRKALRDATSGRRLEDASIGARGLRLIDEGGMTINGGFVRMTDATGSVGLLYFGPTVSGQRTWQFSFPDGELAFGLISSSGNGYWGGLDNQGNTVLSTDSETGVGLAKPYLNIPMVPSSGTSVVVGGPFWPAFTNTSYQEVMHCITTLWHPRIAIGVGTNNGGSGTVEWQLRVDGVTAGSGSGSTADEFEVPGWGDTTNTGDQRSVQLWARNTSGAQSRVIVDRCYGTQS